MWCIRPPPSTCALPPMIFPLLKLYQCRNIIPCLLQFALVNWSIQKGNSAIDRQCKLAQINQTPKLNICYSLHFQTGALKKVTLLLSVNVNANANLHKLNTKIELFAAVHKHTKRKLSAIVNQCKLAFP